MKKFSKIFVLIVTVLSFMLGLSLINNEEKTASALPEMSTYAATMPSEGDGTSGKPYKIRTKDHLSWYVQTVNTATSGTNANAVLMNNIDLFGKIWTPIGNNNHPFKWTFDGNGYLIKNLLIDNLVNSNEIGFFGCLGTNAVIKDLVLENTYIETSGTFVGALAGNFSGNNISIINVAVTGGQIKHIGESNVYVCIGGIVGEIGSGSNLKIENSYSNISINTLDAMEMTSLGGVFGDSATGNLSIKNVYFTGQIASIISLYNNYHGIGKNYDLITKRNTYFAFNHINETGETTPSFGLYNSVGESGADINNVTLKDLALNTYFNNFNEPNWIKVAGEYPLLRGVGNKVVAVKPVETNPEGTNRDYAPPGEASTFYVSYQNLKNEDEISKDCVIYADDYTLDYYKLFRKIGDEKKQEGSTYTNPNRLTNDSFSLVVQPGTRQGYYTFEIETIKLLHEQQVFLRDLATFSKNVINGTSIIDSLSGKISFYLESGEIATGTTKTNRGTSTTTKSWTELSVFRSVKIFTTRGTELTIHAEAHGVYSEVLTYYHSMFLTSSTADNLIINNKTRKVIMANDIEQEEKSQLSVCLSDLYAITFDEELLFNDEDNPSMPKNYGGNTSNISSTILYISRKDGKIFNKNETGPYADFFSEKQDSSSNVFPVPAAKGYEFNGWFSQLAGAGLRFSFAAANAFPNASNQNKNLMQDLMNASSTLTYQGKSYRTPSELKLYGSWDLRSNKVSYVSILNLNSDFGNETYEEYWLAENWNPTKANKIIQESYLIPPGKVGMSLTLRDINGTTLQNQISGSVQSGSLFLNTTNQIGITAGSSGDGYSLRALLITSTDGDMDMLKNTPATFNSSFVANDAQWYKFYPYNEDNGWEEQLIYHLHGDITIYAIYDRGKGEITAQFNLEVPEYIKQNRNTQTGFSLKYDVYEIGNTKNVKNGTVTQDEWNFEENSVYFTIEGLKSGQTIKINSMTLNNSFVFNETNNNPESRINSIYEINGYNIPISYDGTAQEWIITNLIQTNTEALMSKVTVYFEMGFRYKGLSIGLAATSDQNNPVLNIVWDSEFPIGVEQRAQVLFQVNNKDSIVNLQATSILTLQFDNTKRWKPILASENNYKIVVTNLSDEIIENHGLNLVYLDEEDYKLSGFSGAGLLEGERYIVYIVVEPQVYTIEISRTGDENVVNKLRVYNDNTQTFLTFNEERAIITGVSYETINKLTFAFSQNGYQIYDYIVKNNYVNFAPTSFYSPEFRIKDYAVGGTTLYIEVKVEALLTNYKIEYYKENLNNENLFDKIDADTEIVQNTVRVGQLKAIALNPNKYVGFEYYPHQNQVIEATIIYAENEVMTVFKVYYARKIYTIQYNANGGSGTAPTPQNVKYGYEFNVRENTFSNTYYNFVSWNTSSSGAGVTYLQNQIATANSSTVLYAIWAPKTMIVNYESNLSTANYSSQWANIAGYTTFSNQRNAISVVTYSKTFGYVNGVSYSTLPLPSASGYVFAGWWTTESVGGQQILASSPVNEVSSSTTLYARWEKEAITIEYDINLIDVQLTLSYNSKKLYVGSRYSDADVVTLLNAGFPQDVWIGEKVLNLKGWSTSPSPSGGVTYVTEASLVAAGQTTIRLYAHWEVVAPIIVTNPNWAATVTYDNTMQTTLEVLSYSTNTYISNFSNRLTYTYTWFKSGVVVVGQTEAALRLKNVADSGQYTVRVVATHSLWGSSNQSLSSGVGTVIISPMQLNVIATKTGGYITKIYDDTRAVTNISTSNSSIISATAVYDNENVGTGKQVSFTVNYLGSYDPNNFVIYYESNFIENPTNLRTITFDDNSGQITKRPINLNMGNKSGIANGLQYRIEANALTMSAVDLSFLGSKGQSLSGYLLTADAAAGVYSTLGVGLNSYLHIATATVDKTDNYQFVIDGAFEIVEGDLKTLAISKTALLNKDNQVLTNVNTLKFVLRYQSNDISSTGVYNIDGNYFNVINENNSNMVIISTNPEFNGNILISSVGFNYTVGAYNTVAVGHKWVEEGKSDVVSTNISYSFGGVAVNVVKNISIRFTNFSTIHYFDGFNTNAIGNQTVYNTQNGITISHAPLSEEGLAFLGWFDSTLSSSNQISTLWKGYGDVNVYARWSIVTPQIDFYDDDTLVENSISRTYDATTHYVSVRSGNVNLDNLSNKVTYSYSWKVGSQQALNNPVYSYKNATNQTVTLTLDIFFNHAIYQTSNATVIKTINLTVLRRDFDYNGVIEKTYDGTVNINEDGNNFAIVPIVIGAETEYLKLTAKYASKYAAEEIEMTNAVFGDYLSFKKDNYNITFSLVGKITPKILTNVNIGAANDNQKSFDGQVLTINKKAVLSGDLASGDVLDVTIATVSAGAKIYDAGAGEIQVVSWAVWDSSRTVNITSSYDLSSIIGYARISNYEILMQNMLFENTSFVYNGQQRFVYASPNAFAGGIVPSDVEIVYEWKVSGDSTNHTYPIGPTEVGTYLVTMTLYADEINYTIVGANSKTIELRITPKPLTVYIQNDTYYGQGVKSVVITNEKVSGLVLNHIISGSVDTNSNLPSTYSQNSANLVLNLSVKDAFNQERIANYAITVNGSITIEHYYFIEYNGNGGSGLMPKQKVNYGEEVYLSSNGFVKDGYEFSLWNTNSDGTGVSYSERHVVTNLAEHNQTITLYVLWAPAQNTRYYVYHYLQNLDLTYSEQQSYISTLASATENYIAFEPVYYNEKITHYLINIFNKGALIEQAPFEIPSAFVEGFTPVLDNAVLEGIVTPESQGALVLKLYYTRNVYKATFNPNDIVSANEVVSYLFMQEVEEPQTTPHRAGYQFIGWYINFGTVNQTLVTFDAQEPFLMPAKDVFFVAIHQAYDNTPYAIEFYEQNVDGSYSITPTSTMTKAATTDHHISVEFTYDQNKRTSATLRVYNGDNQQVGLDYVVQSQYKGFYLIEHAAEITSGNVNGDGSLVLKLFYARERYDLTIKYHNANPDSVFSYYYLEEVEQPATPTFTGYVFDGWFAGYDEETGYSSKIVWTVIMYDPMTIHAKWLPSTNTLYTVNVFFESLSGEYSQTPNETRQFRNTTNYYAAIYNEVYQGKTSNVLVIFDETKVTRKGVETTFDANGFHINLGASTLSTDILPDGSGVINIYFERNLYTVKFVYNNGDVDSYSSPVKFEQSIAKPDDPILADYVFAGWYLEDTFNTLVNWPFKVQNNTTVMFAKWNNAEDTPYTIETYKQNENGLFGDAQIENYTGMTNNYIVVEQDSETLIWYLREYDSTNTILLNTIKSIEIVGYTYNQNGEITSEPIASGMVIKLYYNINSYTFTYQPNNGQAETTQSVFFASRPTLITQPTRMGYVFAGWYTDLALTNQFNYESFYMPAENVTVYGRWTPAKDTPYKIEYFLQNLDLTYNAEPDHTEHYTGTTEHYMFISDTQIITYETSARTTEIKIEGLKVFIGFAKTANANETLEGMIVGDGTLVLKVYMQRNAYSITFNYNSTEEQKTLSNILYQRVVVQNVPQRAGYAFVGWYYEIGLSTKVNWQAGQDAGTIQYIMEAKDVVLFAKWSANTNTPYITEHYLQNANDDNYTLDATKPFTGITDTNATAQTLVYVGFVVDSENPQSVLSGNIAGDGSLVLKVYYNRAVYLLGFNGNGSTSGTMNDVEFKYGQTQTLPENGFVRTGYTFKGWTDVEGGITVKYAQNVSFTLTKVQNVTLYALWQLDALTEVLLTINSGNANIYYGDEAVLQVNAVHSASVNYTYEWYFNGDRMSHSAQTLTIGALSQSGNYYVRVYAQGTVAQGAQNNLAIGQTNQQNITISPRPVVIDFSETSFVYNAQSQNPTYQINYYTGEGILPPTLPIIKPSSTFALFKGGSLIQNSKNVGIYQIFVTLAQDDNFMLVGEAQTNFEITRRDWDISSEIAEGEFFKDYSYPANVDPTLQKSIKNEETDENVLITFTRQSGEDVGLYNLVLSQETLNNANYSITLDANNSGFAIKKVLSGVAYLNFASTALLSKVYDGQEINVETEVAFQLENLTLSMGATLLSAVFEIKNNSKNVGLYEIELVSASSMEYENIEMASQYYFEIKQRSVELAPGSIITKVYDQTTVYNNFEMINVVAQDSASLSAVGTFANESVGINIFLSVALSGDAKSNYKLGNSFTNLTGIITPRLIKITSNPAATYEYGSFDGIESFTTLGLDELSGLYTVEVDESQISGQMGFESLTTKFNVGTYRTTLGTIISSANYQIANFEAGTVTITAKNVQAVAEWNKYYDGLTTFDKEITLLGAFENDDVFAVATYQSEIVGKLITIDIVLMGDDSQNYNLENAVVYGDIEYKYVSAILDYEFDNLQTPNHSAQAEETLQLIYNKTIAESGYLALPTPWAIGYTFVGWFDENDVMFTSDTLVDNSVWQEDLATKTLTAKWSLGNVNLTVNVVTYSSTNYVIETMDGTQLSSGTFTINGTDYLAGGNVKAIEFGQNALIEAVPNQNYEFDGWYLTASANEIALSTSEIFTVNGNLLTVLMNNNITVYAKFKLKTAVVKLNANASTTAANLAGEYLTWTVVWAEGGFASIQKEFDYNTHIVLPTQSEMSRAGYNFAGWASQIDGEAEYTQLTISGNIELFAVWQSKQYTATFVASTGADETGLLHADKGHFANPIGEDDGIWQKNVLFEQTIGLIQEPVRDRYVFAGWYENVDYSGLPVTADSVYLLTENKTYYAKWIEQTYTVVLTVENTNGGQARIEQSSGIISVGVQNIGTKQILTIQLMSTATLEIYVNTLKGYQTTYTHAYEVGTDFEENIVYLQETQIDIARFNQNLNLNLTFKAMLNEIVFTVPNNLFGSISASVENLLDNNYRAEDVDNDEERVVDAVNGNVQTFTIYAYTGERISINILPFLGYELASLNVNSGNGHFGQLNNGVVSFVGFNEDCTAEIAFVESTHTISLKVGKDVTNNQTNSQMGSFALSIVDKDGNLRLVEENSNNEINLLNITAKTGEKLVINANAFHGFVLSQNSQDYVYAKQNALGSDGTFNFDNIENGTIEFSSFNCGGEIYLPYLRDAFTVEFKVALFDNGTYSEIEEDPSNYINTQITTNYDKLENETQYYNYERNVTLFAQEAYGYKFVGWFTTLNENSLISRQNTYANYRVIGNMTVFAVVEYEVFSLAYSAYGNGHLEGQNLSQRIKYLHDGQTITAISDDGYEFSHWEIYNAAQSTWETDDVNTLQTRQDLSVATSMQIRAVFVASEIEITFNSLQVVGKDSNNNYIYSSEMSEEIGTIEIFGSDERGFTFTHLTHTAETVRVIANPQRGYSIIAYIISQGSKAHYVENDGLRDINLKGFTANFTITAVFDSNTNIFEIAFVKPEGEDYDYNSAHFISGGVITIDPTLYLSTQPFKDKVNAAVRTKQPFEVIFQIAQGYKLITDENGAKVGIKFANSEEIVFAQNVTVTPLAGKYICEVVFTMDNFYEGGEIVLFVEEEKFDVTFYKTANEYKVFELTINSTFDVLDAGYKLPSRVGYVFEGWFTSTNGQGVQYINYNGTTVKPWEIEHTTLYAHWSRAFVTYTLQYIPTFSVADGPLGWNVRENELKRVVNPTTFEYYVGSTTYFQAQNGLDGYIFSHWAKDGEIISTENTYMFEIDEAEMDLFQTLQIVYKVRHAVNSTVGGTARINEQNYVYLLEGEVAVIEATSKLGYEFVGWRIQGTTTIISTEPTLEINYSNRAIVYTAVFEGKRVEIVIQPTVKGSVTSVKVNGGIPIIDDNKQYARLGDFVTFETSAETGYILTGWEINGVASATFSYYEIVMADVNRATITFKPIFSLIDISYEIIFASSGEVKVNNQIITSGRTFATNYFSSVTFTFKSNIRYVYKQITLNGTMINPQYVTVNGSVYTVNLPANLLSLISVNRIALSFDRLFWVDARVEFEGFGTANSPYIISSAGHFAQMAYLINNGINVDSADKVEYASAYYVMFASVDFAERFWAPIGTQEHPFNGIIRLDYERRNITLDANYAVTHYDGLFGYITDNAQFLKEKVDITTGIIVFSSVGAGLIGIVALFSIKTYKKRKRFREQSRIFPTERPLKKD